MKNLDFFKEGIILSVTATMTTIFWFLFKILTMRQIPSNLYSTFIFGVSSVLTFQLFGHLNLFKSMSIVISKYPQENFEKEKAPLNSREYNEKIKSHFIVGFILTFLSSILLTFFLYLNTGNFLISLLYSFDLIFENLNLFFYFLFLGLKKTKIAGLPLITTSIFRLILLFIFSLGRTISLESIISLYTIGSCLAFLTSILLAKHVFRSNFFPLGTEVKEIIRNLSVIKSGITISLISILVQSFSTVMYFLINLFDSSSSKEADVSLMFFSAVLILFSINSVLISVKPNLLVKTTKFAKEILVPFTLLSSIISVLVLLLLFLDLQIFEDVSRFFFNLDYKSLQPYLLLSIIGIPFHSIYVICLGFSLGNGLLKQQFYVNLTSFIIALPFLLIFSFLYGAKGVILSYSLFSFFLAIFSLFVVLNFKTGEKDSLLLRFQI